EMARRYLEAVRTVQPEGPYLLGGWSLGGVVAYEMAQQLTAAGEQVGAVALIDSATPAPGTLPVAGLVGDVEDPMLAYMGLDMAGLGGEQLPDLVDSLKKMSGEERQRFLTQRVQGADMFQRLGEEQRERLMRVFRTNLTALGRYQPAPYAGEVTLLRALRRVETSRDTEGWSALVDRLRVHRVPGHHYSMLKPPYVDELARLLSAALGGGRTDG
ncbi:MAG: hypothetical protein KC583_03020, partial [Myxococcales bacterium]|nr:hypothetical protein [Myxococcales bacterium]